MTLLVGIRCKDGVVVAADRAMTFSAGGTATVSHLACKIAVIKGSVIVAGTGHVGSAQRFREVAELAWMNEIAGKGKSPVAAAKVFAKYGIADLEETGLQPARKDGHHSLGALVAFPSSKGGPQLCEFQTSDFQPELKDAGTWFVSMGSGQLIADSYLAFMRDAFWQDGMPTLKHGMFAAAWVMRQSIRVAPGSVSEPIDIAVLQHDKAHLLERTEIDYHLDVADQATQHFGTFDPSMSAPGVEKTPSEPAPSIPEPTAMR